MSGGGQKADDSEITLVLIVGLFLVLCWGIWVGAKQPLMEAIRWVKWAEISVFQLVDPSLANERRLLEGLKNNQATVKLLDEQARKLRKDLTVKDYVERGLLAPEVLWYISNRVGEYTRWIVALVLIGAATFFMFFSKKTKFRSSYDLEGLIKVQSKHWPVINPIIGFNPSQANARNPGEEVPWHLPLFSEALSPEEWVAHNQIPMVNKVPEKEAVRRAYTAQLGPRWTGLGCLTVAQRCLMAAFALKGAQRRKDSDVLLGKIALAWDHKTDFTPSAEVLAEVSKILNDPKLGGEASKIADHHGYRATAILGVLKWARLRGGVLAPATFLWLRGHDRALWYPLNNLGRRSYHAEAAGVMAHFMAELQATRALPVPRLETAILALLQYWSHPVKHQQTNGAPRVPTVEAPSKKKGFGL